MNSISEDTFLAPHEVPANGAFLAKIEAATIHDGITILSFVGNDRLLKLTTEDATAMRASHGDLDGWRGRAVTIRLAGGIVRASATAASHQALQRLAQIGGGR